MKRLLALLALTFLVGCTTPRPIVNAVSAPLRVMVGYPWDAVAFAVYEQTGLTPVLGDGPVDSLFYCPTHAELSDMDRYIRPKQHLDYVENSNDCDDLAKEWCVLSHTWSVKNITRDAPLSLAAVVCYVRIHDGAFDGRWRSEGLHALGLIVDSDGVCWYVDAQTLWHVKVEEAKFEDTIEAFWIVW